MNKKVHFAKYLLIIALIGLFSIYYGNIKTKELTVNVQLKEAVVSKHVDGDTIYAKIEGKEYKIRFIGIDTPEIYDNQEYFGKEASEYVKMRLPLGTKVYLEKDISEKDKHGRLLRYIWLDKGKMFNGELVVKGYARATEYPPDMKYKGYFAESEKEAKRNGIGMWKK